MSEKRVSAEYNNPSDKTAQIVSDIDTVLFALTTVFCYHTQYEHQQPLAVKVLKAAKARLMELDYGMRVIRDNGEDDKLFANQWARDMANSFLGRP